MIINTIANNLSNIINSLTLLTAIVGGVLCLIWNRLYSYEPNAKKTLITFTLCQMPTIIVWLMIRNGIGPNMYAISRFLYSVIAFGYTFVIILWFKNHNNR